MIELTKATKIKLLKAIKTGVFDSEQFPELVNELKKITIELIDHPSQVNREGQSRENFLNEK